MLLKAGQLYIVATPIGNQLDFSPRAVAVLQDADKIAAEDTRHSGYLLQQFAISTPCVALHEHNEKQVADRLIEEILQGKTIALISDAGTPLISDPGYLLVNRAHAHNIKVIPVPGPSALLAALSASGLPTNRFCFEGFVPAKQTQRRLFFQQRKNEVRTMIFYETPHRILDSLTDLCMVLGNDRVVVLARELTKAYETIKRAKLGELLQWVMEDENQRKGEMVLVIEGFKPEAVTKDSIDPEQNRILQILLNQLPLKQAVSLAVEICGEKKKKLYQQALRIKHF